MCISTERACTQFDIQRGKKREIVGFSPFGSRETNNPVHRSSGPVFENEHNQTEWSLEFCQVTRSYPLIYSTNHFSSQHYPLTIQLTTVECVCVCVGFVNCLIFVWPISCYRFICTDGLNCVHLVAQILIVIVAFITNILHQTNI